ncbi:Cytochrome c oxidase subunit 6b-2 [Camellia lanceoleosa]|uniref:Cytochrome c oxidase subunit 6b-2 n=1 Tax=Camellia lanceoleosa TaxID=1840588 RepID=A0ACC0G5D9_9ERIC|nr:Cytochrome c oxidase subunit 6b-2 [Camellia lanceoleosa]
MSVDSVIDPHEKMRVKEVGTAPFDWRFPTTNQTSHCYSRYLEYHKAMTHQNVRSLQNAITRCVLQNG